MDQTKLAGFITRHIVLFHNQYDGLLNDFFFYDKDMTNLARHAHEPRIHACQGNEIR